VLNVKATDPSFLDMNETVEVKKLTVELAGLLPDRKPVLEDLRF
jgi:hypothetical protein